MSSTELVKVNAKGRAENAEAVQDLAIDDDEALDKNADGGKDRKYTSNSKSLIIDHIILCSSFYLVFSAFIAIQNLQTSLNQADNVGLISLICIYTVFVPCCIFAPAIVSKLGTKWALAVGWTGHCLFTAANFYPILGTMIPASIILGLVSASVWTTQGLHVTSKAREYAANRGQETSAILAKFNGIFWGFFQAAQITGNLVASLVLYRDASPTNINGTEFCGKYDCPSPVPIIGANATVVETESPVQISTVYILMGVFACLDVCGLLVTIFLLKPLPTTEEVSMKNRIKSVGEHFLQVDALLLLPLYLLNGFAQAFVFGEFTKSYITCSVGARDVGYIMVTFGVCDGLTCVLTGPLTDYVSRAVQLLVITCGHTGLVVYLLFWEAGSTSVVILYVVAGAWGVCDGVWQTQTNAYIGERLSKSTDAAFAVLNIFRSLGFALAFALSSFLCTGTKLYILEVIIIIAFVAYSATEIRHRRMQKRLTEENAKC